MVKGQRNPKPKQKRRPTNILVDGIITFVVQYDPGLYSDSTSGSLTDNTTNNPSSRRGNVTNLKLTLEDIPKRYILYHPMLLLNTTFPTHSPLWQRFFDILSPNDKERLFGTIVEKFQRSGQQITHVAVNAPIQVQVSNGIGGDNSFEHETESAASEVVDGATSVNETPNVMRCPFNMQPLYGDFGPDTFVSCDGMTPSQSDFDNAFWVEASQLPGIRQVWAPRWTMFSQGNVREKSRIMGQQSLFPGLAESELEVPPSEIDVVDFYVGIGYFAFPYLRRGVRRVFGWEINGWSVEGLRRGCERNGWDCLVVEVGNTAESQEQAAIIVTEALRRRPKLPCVAFHGDNRNAPRVLHQISMMLSAESLTLTIRHCNLGLLPSSEMSWDDAVALVDPQSGGWLHIHENAEILSVEVKRQQVLNVVERLSQSLRGSEWQISCVHTEMIKTYAPGVGHYVFDIKLWPSR